MGAEGIQGHDLVEAHYTALVVRRWLVLSAFWLLACHAGGDASSASAGPTHTPPPSEGPRPVEPSSAEVPIDADDGVWGAALAPVTIVVFTDLQCPYCSQTHAVLAALERHYGEARLRVVVKHTPLSKHAGAIPAARLAQAVLALNGRRNFFKYMDLAFDRQQDIADRKALDLVGALNLDVSAVAERAGDVAVGQQVLRDVMLAERLKVSGTPHLRINGLGVTGAVPLEFVARLVERELVETQQLQGKGIPADQIYAQRVAINILEQER